MRKNKFNARRIEYRGMVFDSKKEFGRYLVLKDMEKHGKITGLKRQVEYILIDANDRFKGIKYIADFTYRENNEPVIEDVKGLRKGAAYSLFKIKQKLIYDKFRILIREI